MSFSPDHSVRELGSTCLTLRGDLVFTPQPSGQQVHYMVEDPLNSRFFRIGHVEYIFISLLDGKTTLHDAMSQVSNVMPSHRMTESDAAGLCRWLVESDLAHTAESSQGSRLARNANTLAGRQRLARWNPLVFRIPLMQPDRMFGCLAKYIGWLYSWPMFAAWLMLFAIGAYQVVVSWDRFSASSYGVFGPGNWFYLGLAWVLLKVVHETSHGVVCRRYGGNVREMGILCILFAPLAYVDVTSSWRFRSRWQRMHVAAAGMYIELLVAAVAAIVWSQCEAGWLSNLCFNVIVMASVTTILFNANPLMKFDGYYILSDGLAIPNLYVMGQQYTRYLGRKFLLGMTASLPAWPKRQGAFIRFYGVASLFWRIVVCVGLTVTAATLFHGAGVVLAVLALLMWVGLPSIKFARFLLRGKPGERPNLRRFAWTSSLATAAIILVFGFVPWPGARSAPAIVEYSPHTILRAASPGFVREVHVCGGEMVEQNQLLFVLENRELTYDLNDLKIQIQQSEVKGRQHEQKSELAAQQAEAEKRAGLRKQLVEKEMQVDRLEIRAPHAGNIVSRNLESLPGTYLDLGDEIVAIGDERRKELRVSVAQDDLDVFRGRTGKPLNVDLPGEPIWRSTLEKVIPRATLTPTHPAMAATNGGPLAVTQPAPSEQGAADQLQLFAPRFTAVVKLTRRQSEDLHSGQLGSVSYRACDESVGQHLYNSFSRWLRERLKPPPRS